MGHVPCTSHGMSSIPTIDLACTSSVLVLVCDAARARFFDVRAGDPTWHLVIDVTHDGSRQKAADLVTDQAGRRSSEGAATHHNALAPSSSPKDVQKELFARELAKTLDAAMRGSRLRHWVLVAAPHFAGTIRKHLTPELTRYLLGTLQRDLTREDPAELARRVGDLVLVPLDQQGPVRKWGPHPH